MHIFISYSKKNQDYARKVADQLLDFGFDVWIDDRIDYGEDWWATIVQAIRDSAAFVVIMTPDSDASRWVQREVTIADELGKPTFPLLLDGDIRASKNWLIYVRTQFADVRGGSLPPRDFYMRLSNHAVRKASRGQEAGSSYAQIPEPDEQAKTGTAQASLISKVYDLLPAPFEWISIRSGIVTLITQNSSTGRFSKGREDQNSHNIPNFAISKYPITNLQFAKFIEANGYDTEEWWTPDGWQQKTAHGWKQPQFWEDRKWNKADCPVVGVSWYEAAAFCLWLSEASGESILMPSEKQWQRAAQGDDDRLYPWGNDFDETCCNYNTSSTTPVTEYESTGASPFGVVDMSGNVWEWCLTAHPAGGEALTGSDARVLKGGAWWGNLSYKLRVVNRNWADPAERDAIIGFRITHG